MQRSAAPDSLRQAALAMLLALCVIGAACSVLEREEAVDATPESLATPVTVAVPRTDMAGPQENRDHWHSVYGVYSCNRVDEGAGRYLPAFQSWQDDTGIHSHGDGLIHIHPFFARSALWNARFEHWFSEMKIEVSTESIVVSNQFDDPVNLVAGEDCADGTGPAEIRILQWNTPFDPTNPPPPDNVFTDDLGSVRFVADAEVFVIAYANAATFADLPAPPGDRFEALGSVSGDINWIPANRPGPIPRRTPAFDQEPAVFSTERIEFEPPSYSASELREDEPLLYAAPPASLTQEGYAALERVAEQLLASDAKVEIRVYSVRPSESPYDGFDISVGRAVVIRDVLTALGVPTTRLLPVAYDAGQGDGIDRVEFVVVE